MDNMITPAARRPHPDHAMPIARALATEGGHLAILYGGFTPHCAGGWITGRDVGDIRADCIAAGLPVMDCRDLPLETVWDLVVCGPMVAVGEQPSPAPYGAASCAPLAVVAEAYRAAGAEVLSWPASGSRNG